MVCLDTDSSLNQCYQWIQLTLVSRHAVHSIGQLQILCEFCFLNLFLSYCWICETNFLDNGEVELWYPMDDKQGGCVLPALLPDHTSYQLSRRERRWCIQPAIPTTFYSTESCPIYNRSVFHDWMIINRDIWITFYLGNESNLARSFFCLSFPIHQCGW